MKATRLVNPGSLGGDLYPSVTDFNVAVLSVECPD